MTEELVSFETARLAKAKGFDEVCRNLWQDFGESQGPIDAPKDEELIGNFMGMAVKHRNDWESFIMWLADMGAPKVLRNSTLPATIYARPSQDLLERWLREEKGIHVYAKIMLGWSEKNIPPLFTGGCYSTMDKMSADKWSDVKAFPSYTMALEEALNHALTLLT